MFTLNTLTRFSMLLVGTSLLSACQSEQQNAVTNVEFEVPSRLVQLRAVNPEQLRPRVTLSTGESVLMEPNGDNGWTGSINVQPNNTYFVFVTWVETLPQGDLVLAEWSRNVDVDETGGQVILGSGDYNYTADFDGDNISNIKERENDTDPFVHNDQLLGDGGNEQNAENDETANSDDSESSNTPDTETDSEQATSNDTDSSNTDEEPAAEEPTSVEVPTDIEVDVPDDANEDDDAEADSDDEEVDTDTDTDSDLKPELATVIIPRIAPANAPSIDGDGVRTNGQDKLIGEWAAAVQFDIDDDPLLIDRLMINNNSDSEDGDPYRSWAAMHDGINLYILVLSDDIGARHGDSVNVWEDDALELFIDADNSKFSMYGDPDDFHYMIPLLKSDRVNANRASDGRIQPGPMSSEVELDIDFHTGLGNGPDGIRFPQFEQDVYEIAIPLAQAGIQIGQAFGLELQIDDDDNGGGRESKWGWFHPSRVDGVNTDTTYLDPSVMGTVVLGE